MGEVGVQWGWGAAITWRKNQQNWVYVGRGFSHAHPTMGKPDHMNRAQKIPEPKNFKKENCIGFITGVSGHI